jgi:DNA processing protein
MKDFVAITDPRYPKPLKKISKPPEKLHFKGDWDTSLFCNCLTVVGSRRRTTYGQTITNQLVTQLASAGITIVSGFMYGIDADAHQATVDSGCKTIAVMPCGVEVIHPAYQKNLYQEILDNQGLIISEFPKTYPPAVWTYPRRNRIMAALSKATLIIEAAPNSGTLITAKYAKEFGKKLFAVPGPLTSKNSIGTAQLIKEDAQIVTSADDILEYYNLINKHSQTQKKSTNTKDSLETKVLEKLKREPLEIDQLSRFLKIPVSELGKIISLMELKSLLLKEKGKYYIKT